LRHSSTLFSQPDGCGNHAPDRAYGFIVPVVYEELIFTVRVSNLHLQFSVLFTTFSLFFLHCCQLSCTAFFKHSSCFFALLLIFFAIFSYSSIIRAKMFDLCSKICTALKPQCGINFVRKIFRILEKFLKYNLWKHKNNSIEQYIRETNRNNKQLTSKKYAAQTSDFGCNEQQLTSILTQSDRSNRKCLILESRFRETF
jgi:hypothetical protein